MGMYAVQHADSTELGEFRNAANLGRSLSKERRRQLSQGQQAMNGGNAPEAADNRHANGAGAAPTPNGQGPSNGGQRAPAATAESTNGVAAAHLGRALSKERRRQLSSGKQALTAGAGQTAAAAGLNGPPDADSRHGNGAGAAPTPNGQGSSNGGQRAPAATAESTNGVAAAHLGRALSKERRRQLSQGRQALTAGAGQTAAAAGLGGPPAAEDRQANGAGSDQGPSNGSQRAPRGTDATDGVAAAHLGRALSKERRRQLSQGRQALTAGAGQTAAAAGLGGPPAAEDRQANGAGSDQGPSNGTQRAPRGTDATDGVAAAHLGRALSKERRRQLSQGKQALTAGAGQTAAAAGLGGPDADEGAQVNGAGPGREQARARRAQATRSGRAVSRPQQEGRVTHPPKVIVSPTPGDQRVTGLRIGPGVGVTGDEPGAALPVSGTQYVAADGPPPPAAAGTKVGRVRTPKGLVVSGTTVRGTVPVTGDEAGEHLRITGEADQKLRDDLTPRRDGNFRPAQFPRRADPQGATAVGTRLGLQIEDGPGYALEITDDGRPVTGTAVGRSGRVTGNEAGACRSITGDQYQGLSYYSSECAGIGGGTAPAAHLNRERLDPATGGKVSVAQTWSGQIVTGPSVEYRPNVTGDEPGSCRSVTGTPYQGPSTTFGWCEPDQAESVAQRNEARPDGVAVTGDLPTTSDKVTGTERGQRKDISGSSYYSDMRPAEPAAEDWTRSQAFPVALARRLAGGESEKAATREARKAAPPVSSVPGGITGAFAVGDGMVTGNNEFLFRPRTNREAKPEAVTGEGRTEGRTITGSAAAWTSHDLVTGTEGFAAGRNPTEGGGRPHGWAGAGRFKELATPGPPRQTQNVTGLSGWNSQAAARVTLSGGAQG